MQRLKHYFTPKKEPTFSWIHSFKEDLCLHLVPRFRMCGSTWITLPLYLPYHIGYKTFFYTDMEIKPTNAYQHLKVSYITNILSLLHVHVSATLVAILREVSYKGYITKTKDQCKFKKVSSKMYGLFYILIHVHVGGELEVWGSNLSGSEIIHAHPDWPWDPPSLLYNGYQVFPRGKAAGTWC